MKRAGAWIALLFAGSVASAPVDLTQLPVFAKPADAESIRAALGPVTQELASALSISGPYTQKKFLRELPQPLRSQGDFLFVRDLGVAWRTTAPFPSELIVTRDALIQRDAGSRTRVGADQQPAVRMVARIFFAVFSLDFAQLSELFTLSVLPGADGRWELGLRPRHDAGTIDGIVVSGAREVERVVLYEHGGDRTEIEFRDARISSAAPDDALRARFQ